MHLPICVIFEFLSSNSIITVSRLQCSRKRCIKIKNFHAFPPFSLIGAALVKIRRDRSTGITIIPWWENQFLFPLMPQFLLDFPIQLPHTTETLNLSSKKGNVNPLHPKLKLLEVILSGRQSATDTFKFLHDTHNDGCLYSDLCAARSDFAIVITIKALAKLSDHPVLVRYLKWTFNRHPSFSRYKHICNMNLVLTYYCKFVHNEELTL